MEFELIGEHGSERLSGAERDLMSTVLVQIEGGVK